MNCTGAACMNSLRSQFFWPVRNDANSIGRYRHISLSRCIAASVSVNGDLDSRRGPLTMPLAYQSVWTPEMYCKSVRSCLLRSTIASLSLCVCKLLLLTVTAAAERIARRSEDDGSDIREPGRCFRKLRLAKSLERFALKYASIVFVFRTYPQSVSGMNMSG